MTGAEMWVRENSQAKGSAWWLMLALAERAQGCVAISTAEELVEAARISHRELYRALLAQCQLGEIERLSQPRDPKPVRAFHFAKMNCVSTWRSGSFQHPLCPCKQSTVPDLRKKTTQDLELSERSAGNYFPQDVLRVSAGIQLLLLPEIHEAKLRAFHAEEPLWQPASTPQSDMYFLAECRALAGIGQPQQTGMPRAEQRTFDWDVSKAISEKARLEKWARELGVRSTDDPKVKREKALPENVIVFQRRTA